MPVNNIQPQPTPATHQSNLNGISKDDVKNRLRELNQDAPIFFTTSFIKEPQEISLRAVARNNIMLEQILQNQAQILENQEKILGSHIDVNA